MPTDSPFADSLFADLAGDDGNGGATWELLAAHHRVPHEPSPYANGLPPPFQCKTNAILCKSRYSE